MALISLNRYKKSRPGVGAALFKLLQVCVYFALTFAIPTRIRSLIIRTARTTTIRDRETME
jgi:hypothetical protein